MQITFETLGITSRLSERLHEREIVAPAPIQVEAIPVLLRGGDAVIRSRTGTGKTLAYLLPLLDSLDSSSDKLQAVVLAPTAELSMQIHKEAAELLEGTGLRTAALIGGASLQRQLEKLKRSPQLVVGTPGRILECIELKKLKPAHVRMLVIDEADQTFALGAGGEAELIIGKLPGERQLVFCSATMPEPAKQIVEKWTKETAWLETEEEERRLPSTVEHVLIVSEERDRIDTVRRLIRMLAPPSAMLFVNDTDSIAEVESKLRYHGLPVGSIYGDQPKQERSSVMRRFRDGKLKLLLATDVAARGLDAPDVTHVIHLDPPRDADGYLHRAGRTGRMGRSGTSVLILAPNRMFIAKKFAEQLHISFEKKSLYGGKLIDRSSSPVPPPGNAAAPKERPKAPPTAGKPQAKPKAPPAKDRLRERKNKGAPKWLKAKREANGGRLNGDEN